MAEITADRATKIKEEAALDAKNVTEKYNKAEKDGVGVATTELQKEVNDFHNRAGQTPEERKLYMKTLTEALEAGEDGKGKNALLPKISEAWLLNPDNKVLRNKVLTADRLDDRIQTNERFAQIAPEQADLLMLDTAMSEDIKKTYFTNGNSFVSEETVKNKVTESEKSRGGDISRAAYAAENNDIAKVLLDNPKLFNALDAAKNGSRDGYISYTDVSKFVTEYNDQSNPNAFQNFTPQEAAAVQKLKERWDNINNQDANGNYNGVSDIMYSGTFQYFLTQDSLKKGLKSVEAPKTPANVEEATYDNGVTRKFKYDNGKLSEISDGTHVYTVKPAASGTGNELWEGNTKTKFTDAAVAPNGDFTYKEDGLEKKEAAKTKPVETPKTPANVEEATYDNNVTRRYKYENGKLSEISDGTHVYTVKPAASGTGNELWEGNTKTKFTDAAVAPNGDFTYKEDGLEKKEAAKTKPVETPKTPANVEEATYDNNVTRKYKYENGKLSEISDGTHVYTVKPAASGTGNELWEGNTKTKFTDAAVAQNGDFTYKEDGLEKKEAAKVKSVEPVKSDDKNANLTYDTEKPAQLNSVRYQDGVKMDFEYENGNTAKIVKFTRSDATGRHEYTVKENGDVFEGDTKVALSKPTVDQKTGEFSCTFSGKEQKLKVAPQFKDLAEPRQKELEAQIAQSLHVGNNQGYWQVAEQVLKVNGNKNPAAADVKELMVILQKANIDKATNSPKKVLKQGDVLLTSEQSAEFKALLNRLASEEKTKDTPSSKS